MRNPEKGSRLKRNGTGRWQGVEGQAARERGIPVLVEGERLRPGLSDLLEQADFVSTSARFPQVIRPLPSLSKTCHRRNHGRNRGLG